MPKLFFISPLFPTALHGASPPPSSLAAVCHTTTIYLWPASILAPITPLLHHSLYRLRLPPPPWFPIAPLRSLQWPSFLWTATHPAVAVAQHFIYFLFSYPDGPYDKTVQNKLPYKFSLLPDVVNSPNTIVANCHHQHYAGLFPHRQTSPLPPLLKIAQPDTQLLVDLLLPDQRSSLPSPKLRFELSEVDY